MPTNDIPVVPIIFLLIGSLAAAALDGWNIPAACFAAGSGAHAPAVEIVRLPKGGVQPQITRREDGAVYVIYLSGEAGAADILFMRSTDEGRTFSRPMRVNGFGDSAIAAGTIRGPHIAIGTAGRLHVAWNGPGPSHAPGAPHPGMSLLYMRMSDDGETFEPARRIAREGLDGGASIAANDNGEVCIVWHAAPPGRTSEQARRIWLARSEDDGESFTEPVAIDHEPRGACACCGLKTFLDTSGRLFVLYRSAETNRDRDMTLLISSSGEDAMQHEQILIERWTIGQCVMSSASFAQLADRVLGAWETERRVRWSTLSPDSDGPRSFVEPPEQGEKAKHPVLAVNPRGEILLAWTENTAWAQGGDVAWQVFDAAGAPIEGASGRSRGLPIWGCAAAFARDDGSFVVMY